MKLRGALTALITPFKSGAIDKDALASLIEAQIAGNISGIVVAGTTGESATLTDTELKELIGLAKKLAKGRLPIIAGAGANSTAVATARSRLAQEAGADALLHVTPYYNKPPQEGMYKHFAACAKATSLPVILYNVPGRTRSDLLPETVERLAEIPNITAIKEATGDLARGSDVIQRVGSRMDILSGDDFTAFPLMALGGHGVISVVSNVAPRLTSEMCAAATSGNWNRARDIHNQLLPLCTMLFEESNPIPVKAALAELGQIGPEIRLPLVPCSPELAARISRTIKEKGIS